MWPGQMAGSGGEGFGLLRHLLHHHLARGHPLFMNAKATGATTLNRDRLTARLSAVPVRVPLWAS